MTIYARKECICNSKEPHFCPPSFGEEGFYACDVEDIASNVAELEAWKTDYADMSAELEIKLGERIAELEGEPNYWMKQAFKARHGEEEEQDQLRKSVERNGELEKQLRIKTGEATSAERRWKEHAKCITDLKKDCVDMAEDIIAEATYRYGVSSEDGIHLANVRRYNRDTETARKYTKDKEA